MTVVVIGGGIAGLTVAHELVKAGYRVILLEAEPHFGAKSSTKNHGWLHHSGCFYLLIHGLEVVQQCQEGAREILRIAPHSVEPWKGTYLLTADPNLAHRYSQRCKEAGLPLDELSVKDLYDREPALRGSPIKAAFSVSDRPFRPSAVLEILRHTLVEAGVQIRCGTRVRGFRFKADRIVGIQCVHNGTCEELPASFVVNATGAYGQELLQTTGLSTSAEIRVFRSSLLVVEPALTMDTMLISLDPKGATVVPHVHRTVVGVNGDSQPLEDPEEAQSTQASIDAILHGMTDLLPNLRRRNKSSVAYVWTCHKAELVSTTNTKGRSPAYAVQDHSEQGVSNLLTCLPGKFTTAPVMARAVVTNVQEKLPLLHKVRGQVLAFGKR